MKQTVYGILAGSPIDFPREVQLRVYPHNRDTGEALGGCCSLLPHRSWDWIQAHIPIASYEWARLEEMLKQGQTVKLAPEPREHTLELPDEVDVS